MDNAKQLVQMSWGSQLAWVAAAIGITLTASLTLLGIWRRGYPKVEPSGTRTTSRDDGIKWIFLACTLWCFTSVVQAVKFFATGSLRLKHPALTFIFVLVSVTNSLFFVLATANLEAITEESGLLAPLLERIRCGPNPYWILGILIVITTGLRFINPSGKYFGYTDFDVLVSLVTIFLITWGFFKSFWTRNFRIVACLSVPVFLIFTVAQVGDFLDYLTPHLESVQRDLLSHALSIGSDGMVALLFVALTFSWIHEKGENLIESIPMLPTPPYQDAKSARSAS